MKNKQRQSATSVLISLFTALILTISGCAFTTSSIASPRNETAEKFQNQPERTNELVITAMSLLNIGYRPGGNTPDTGMDCSGFVRYVFKAAWGSDLPRTSGEISQRGIVVSPGDLEPGDLVFYNTRRRKFSHVGIYLGDDKFIHSPTIGGQVRIEKMSTTYWRTRFNGARRLQDPSPGSD